MLTCYATPQDHDLMRGYMKDCSPTVSAAAGMSGNNRPFFCRTSFVKVSRARHKDGDGERWDRQEGAPTLNLFDLDSSGGSRAVTLVAKPRAEGLRSDGKSGIIPDVVTARFRSAQAGVPGGRVN